MNALRLVLVSPRYWPLVGEAERFVAQLVDGFRAQVAQTTILTARWAMEWPPEVLHRDTPTVRLAPAPLGGWSTYRYMRSLARQLRDHRPAVDLVYVMNLRQDAYAVLGALRDHSVAVVLRPKVGDCCWLETARLGGRLKQRILQADAVVGPTRSLHGELLRAGFSPERAHFIPNGVELAEPRSAAARYRARLALADANHDLAAPEFAPVAVAVGPLCDGRHLFELVDAWRRIAGRWPSARLWLLGDGPFREALHERIVDLGVHHNVFLPGTFDELLDVFQAADVFVATAPATDGSQFVLEAMAAGLPVVAVDSPDHREVISHGVCGLLVPPGDRAALAEAVAEMFDAPQVAARYGEAARCRVESGFSAARMAEAHLALFQQVLDRRQRGRK